MPGAARCFCTAAAIVLAGRPRGTAGPSRRSRAAAARAAAAAPAPRPATPARSPANASCHRPASRSSGSTRAAQVVARQPGDVLLVEPLELLGIEDGVPAADALEREARDQLVAREHLLVAAPGDHPSSARKFTIASGRMPCRWYSVTDVAPCRFDSRFLSGPRISGTCANCGSGAPERLVEQHLLRRVRNVVLAPHHVRDPPCPHRRRRPTGGTSDGRRCGGRRSPRCWRDRTRSRRAPGR